MFDGKITGNSGDIFFARHCSTEWSERFILQGKTDLDLSTKGSMEAKKQSLELISFEFNVIISSTLKRSQQTAEIYSRELNIPFIVEDGIKELDHGGWEGNSFSDLESKNILNYLDWLNAPHLFPIPLGSERIEKSVAKFNESVNFYSKEYIDKRILFITHKHIYGLWIASIICKNWNLFNKMPSLEIKPIQTPMVATLDQN